MASLESQRIVILNAVNRRRLIWSFLVTDNVGFFFNLWFCMISEVLRQIKMLSKQHC